MKPYIIRLLDPVFAKLMWLVLHYDCWRDGHDWQINSPDYSWCEHCEDQARGDKARKLFIQRKGIDAFWEYVNDQDKVHQPLPPLVVDDACPSDRVYLMDRNLFPHPEGLVVWDNSANADADPKDKDKVFIADLSKFRLGKRPELFPGFGDISK